MNHIFCVLEDYPYDVKYQNLANKLYSLWNRIRVLCGNCYCPDCYSQYGYCHDKCGRRHQKELSEIGNVISNKNFNGARDMIAYYTRGIRTIDDNDPEIIRLYTFIEFMSGDD